MEKFLEAVFSSNTATALTAGVIFLAVFFRYIFISGAYHYLFFRFLKKQFHTRLINDVSLNGQQAKVEIYRSFLTSIIFAVSGIALLYLMYNGFSEIYYEWSSYPFWYHPLSIFLALFIHETYYYWLHRWMHRPKIYRFIHKWHHDSIKTSSLTSFSFHPIESILQALVVPAMILFLPLHIYTLFFLLFIMTMSGTINHASVEIFPKGFEKNWLGKWLIGATHHDMHHKQFRFNFGLYFTFWDKWMGTESPKYEETFRKYTE